MPDALAPLVDESTGVVAPGSQRFGLSMRDTVRIDNAESRSRVDCMQARGYSGDQLRWKDAPVEYGMRSGVGVWRIQDAQQYAFSPPLPLADQVLNGKVNSSASAEDVAQAKESVADLAKRLAATDQAAKTPEYAAASAACDDDPEVARWTSERKSLGDLGGPWDDEFSAAETAAFQDPGMAAVKADYVACLATDGLAPADPQDTSHDGLFTVQGGDGDTIDEAHIQKAVIAVQCKQSTDAVRRVMDLWAQYEAPVYLRHQSELDANRLKIEALLAEVDAFWAAHSD